MNTLVDEYNNTYHHSINKKSINGDYSDLTEKIDTHSKVPQFKDSELKGIRIFLVKLMLKIGNFYYRFCFEN